MYKNRVKQSIENIKPNGSVDIQNIVTCSEVMLEGVLPAIHEMLNYNVYTKNFSGDDVCMFCDSANGYEHEDECAYDRLKKIARFMHKE